MMGSFQLLAQIARPEELGRRFRGPASQFDWTDLLGLLLFVVAAVALVFLLRWLLQRQQGIHRCYHPRRLFRELCRVHGLSRQESKVLWQLAQYLRLEHPATLFLLRELWEEERLGPEWAPWQPMLQQLRLRLFGPDESDKTPAENAATRKHQPDSPQPAPSEGFLTDLPLEVETPELQAPSP